MPDTNEVAAPTSVSEWRSKPVEGFVVALPSGKSVKMRRTLDMFELLRQGRIPNPLAGAVRKMMDGGNKNIDVSAIAQDPKALEQFLDMLNSAVARAILEPKVVMTEDGNPPEDALDVTEIDLDDRMFIFMVAQGGATDLEQFRNQQDEFMATAQDGQGVPSKAKRPARSK